MRKWTETVKSWPAFDHKRLYHVCVKAIQKSPQGKSMLADLEFLEGPQKGRRLREALELPIRPEGRTADFFRACGREVNLKATLSPPDTVGSVIRVRLERNIMGQWQITDFEPFVKDTNHESNNS